MRSATLMFAVGCVVTGLPLRGVAQVGAAGSPRPVTLPFTYEHTIRSRINNREYVIQVALPFASREATAGTRRFPALYILDGDWDLPKAATSLRSPSVDGPSGVVLVGVGYPPGKTPGRPPPGGGETDYRWRDYTPPHIPGSAPKPEEFRGHPEIGGAALFLRVLREEVIPFVERNYPVTDDRGLYGHSLGGAFALYALLEAPDTFSRYAISSASYWWDNHSWILREKKSAAVRTSLAKRVYVSIGELESIFQDVERGRLVVALCEGRRTGPYKGLSVLTEVIRGEDHQSMYHLLRAAQVLYPRTESLNPPEPVLQNPCPGR